MESDETQTAYCGLYCGDCIPANHPLFIASRKLDALLKNVQFDQYAELKAQANPEFQEYTTFARILEAINGLECSAPCRAGGGKRECQVRDCVIANSLAGCWECKSHPQCDLLAPLKRVHPNLDHHLKLINKYGKQDWVTFRKEHYFWQARGSAE